MLEKVRKTINKYSLLQKGDRVLVAVSGGPDSVALLLALLKIKKEYSLTLGVAHVNYHLRKNESNKDRDFVKKLAEKYGLPFFAAEINGKKEFKGGDLQEKAREFRYAFFSEAVRELKAGKLAIGHNRDDQVETVLMRFLRGAGAGGLTGIPVKRGFAPGVTLIRPLFETKREAIELFLKKNKIRARRDKSNYKDVYLRNKLRLRLLPLLKKEYNNRIEENIFRMAEILAPEDDFLRKEALKTIKNAGGEYFIPEKALNALPAGLKQRALRELIRLEKGDLKGLESKHLTGVAEQKKSRSLPGGRSLLCTGGKIIVVKNKETTGPESKRLKVPGITVFGNKKVAVTIKDMVKYFGGKNEAFLDAKKVSPPLFLRSRRAGDRFMPFGMTKYKKVQDFMVDEKIPAYKRAQVPVLTDDRGEILWLAGYRPDERFRVTKKTKKIICLKLLEVK